VRLYLVRHGAAEDKGGRPDAERALTAQGREDVAIVASAIGPTVERPLNLVSSPYLRAEQTAEVLREALRFPEKIEPSDALLPESNWPKLRDVLARQEAAGVHTIIGVGHNPSISQICATILSGSDEVGLDFAKGAVACLDLEDLQGRPAGSLRWLVTPHMVRRARASASSKQG
jgi:phosphohistidine phosphatase